MSKKPLFYIERIKFKGVLCNKYTGKKIIDITYTSPGTVSCLHMPKMITSTNEMVTIVLCKECHKLLKTVDAVALVLNDTDLERDK